MLHEGMMIYVRRMLHERMILHQEDNAVQGTNILLYINEYAHELPLCSRAPDHCARLVIVKTNICSACSWLVKIKLSLFSSTRDFRKARAACYFTSPEPCSRAGLGSEAMSVCIHWEHAMSNYMDHGQGHGRIANLKPWSQDQIPPPYRYSGRCFVRNPRFTPHWQNSQKVSIYKCDNHLYVWWWMN